MRNDDELAKTLFMVISSETRFEMLDPVRQAGVVAILSRPFTQEALTQAVNNSLGYLDERAIVMDHQKLSSLRILLVDDSRLARRHMLDVLEKMGVTPLQVIQAENGHEAIEKLNADTFDLVLTDYNMPQMDGEELLKCIRQNPALDRIPVIMVTSEENETKLASIKSHGVTAMLNKPFDPPNLKALIEHHL